MLPFVTSFQGRHLQREGRPAYPILRQLSFGFSSVGPEILEMKLTKGIDTRVRPSHDVEELEWYGAGVEVDLVWCEQVLSRLVVHPDQDVAR